MEHRPLGRTGVSVSKLCLGAMMFGDWGTKDHDESIRIIHRALDAGINFIDTADVYSEGESEVIVGKALGGGKRDDVVLATKVHMPMAGGWLSGRYREGSEPAAPASAARRQLANRFDLSLAANQRKLDAAEQLAELAEKAGMTLIEMAIAFVLRHPAVTSVIIGPRMM